MAWAWADPIRRAAQVAARTHGIEVVELAGWRERGHGTTQGVLRGTMWHDTVTRSGMSRADLFRLLRDGYKSLPGPIANVGLDRDGTLGLIAAGRAYHAGSGDWPGIPSGNLNTCGIEAANAGKGSGERWTQIQRAVALTFTRELHRLEDLEADTAIGHLEWAEDRKVDPWSIDMPAVRRQIAKEATMSELDWAADAYAKMCANSDSSPGRETRNVDRQELAWHLEEFGVLDLTTELVQFLARLKDQVDRRGSYPSAIGEMIDHLRDHPNGAGGASVAEVVDEVVRRLRNG